MDRDYALLALLRLAIERLSPKATSVVFVVPTLLTKDGKVAEIGFAANLDLRVPLVFEDASGAVVKPVLGGSVSVDRTDVATAVLSDDSAYVTLVSVGPGSATVTYTNGALTAVLSFDVTVFGAGNLPDGGLTAVRVRFDTANVVPVPKV